MPAEIIQTNGCLITPAYVPIFFEIAEFTTLGAGIPALEIDITCTSNVPDTGNVTKTFRFKPTRVFDGGGIQSNFYSINISEFIQCCFANEETLCPLKEGYMTAAGKCFVIFQLKMWSLIPNEDDGCLEREEDFVLSEVYTAYNGKREHCENQCPEELYVPTTEVTDANPFGVPSTQWMTNKPFKTVVCLEDSECICWFHPDGGLSSVQLQLNNEFGIAGNGFFLVSDNAGGVDNQPICLGVGPANINAQTDWLVAPPPIDETITFYDVTITTPSGQSLVRRYYVNPCCCPAYRIHFLNCYGKWDAFTAYKNVEDFFEVKSKTFEKVMPLFVDQRFPSGFPQSRGINRLQARGKEGFNLHAQKLRKEEMNWLKELLLSPNIFLEKDCKYIPIYLKDASMIIEDTYADDRELKLKFYYSNDHYSQRN